MAKNILKREKKLTLSDVALETGFYLGDKHNAFHDVFATIAILSFLCKLRGEKDEKVFLVKRKKK